MNGLIRSNYKFDKKAKSEKKYIEAINIINEGIDLSSEMFKLKTFEAYNNLLAQELGNTRANVATSEVKKNFNF